MVVEVNRLSFTQLIVPSEDNSPLPIDTNRMESSEVTSQFLKMIARRRPQVPITRRVINHLQFAKQPVRQIGGDLLSAKTVNEETA